LPRVATWQCGGRESYSGPVDRQVQRPHHYTTRLIQFTNINNL